MAPSSCPFPEQSVPALPLSPGFAPGVSSGEVWLLKMLFQSSLKEAAAPSVSASRAISGSGWPIDLGWTLEEGGESLAFVLEK